MKKIFLPILTLVSLVFWSCNDDFDEPVQDAIITAGTADFSRYISIGNSLTAGHRDGALYSSGQIESYPNILATQMSLAGGGVFTQPMMPNNVGGFTNLFTASGGKDFYGKFTLQVVNGSLSPVPSVPVADLDILNTKVYNNMGIPGAKSFHLIAPGYGNPAGLAAVPATANPYYVRFASSATSTVLGDALSQNPTFFSLWIGNNDVLGYATSGGDGSNPITPSAQFDMVYEALLSGNASLGISKGLASDGRKGVVANIPYVTSIPFFTTVPYDALSSSNPDFAAQIPSLQILYGGLNAIYAALGVSGRDININSTGNTALIIKDETLTDLSAQITAAALASGNTQLVALAPILGPTFGQARQATAADLILLTSSSVIGSVEPTATAPFNIWGISKPLDDKHVLSATEVSEVITATNAFNNTIKNLATTNKLAFVDANAKMKELATTSGIKYNGTTYTASFVNGGAFSLDGVHPTGRGYAIIANEFVRAINEKYGATLPQVDPNNYSGIVFP